MRLVIRNMREGYPLIVDAVRQKGHPVAPRGQATLELPDLVVWLEDPTDALPIGNGRQINPAIAAAEAIQLVGQFSDPGLMLRISLQFEKFLEEDGEFWGAYGRRVGSQVIEVCRKLTQDRDTRQAVVTLWEPRRDNQLGKRDYPCTLSFVFQIRNDKLELHATMRSNDVWLGFAYDVFQFTQLQLTVARALDVEPGTYFHHAISMHLYQRDFEESKRLTHESTASPPGITGFGRQPGNIFGSMMRARRIGSGKADSVRAMTPSERWYLETLQPYLDA